jgi:H+/gluconate symporter-like permease
MYTWRTITPHRSDLAASVKAAAGLQLPMDRDKEKDKNKENEKEKQKEQEKEKPADGPQCLFLPLLSLFCLITNQVFPLLQPSKSLRLQQRTRYSSTLVYGLYWCQHIYHLPGIFYLWLIFIIISRCHSRKVLRSQRSRTHNSALRAGPRFRLICRFCLCLLSLSLPLPLSLLSVCRCACWCVYVC